MSDASHPLAPFRTKPSSRTEKQLSVYRVCVAPTGAVPGAFRDLFGARSALRKKRCSNPQFADEDAEAEGALTWWRTRPARREQGSEGRFESDPGAPSAGGVASYP